MFLRQGASSNIGGAENMAVGAVGRGKLAGAGLGAGVAATDPYQQAVQQTQSDVQSALSIYNTIFGTPIPQQQYTAVQTAPAMSTTTMLMIGGVGIAALYFLMK